MVEDVSVQRVCVYSSTHRKSFSYIQETYVLYGQMSQLNQRHRSCATHARTPYNNQQKIIELNSTVEAHLWLYIAFIYTHLRKILVAKRTMRIYSFYCLYALWVHQQHSGCVSHVRVCA